MARFSMTRRGCGLLIAATLGAVSSTARSRGGHGGKHRRFRFHAKGAHRESRDDNCLPQSRKHSRPRASSIPRRLTVSRSHSLRRDPTAIFAACIRKCRAGSSSHLEARATTLHLAREESELSCFAGALPNGEVHYKFVATRVLLLKTAGCFGFAEGPFRADRFKSRSSHFPLIERTLRLTTGLTDTIDEDKLSFAFRS
jgi:hypothetical protein